MDEHQTRAFKAMQSFEPRIAPPANDDLFTFSRANLDGPNQLNWQTPIRAQSHHSAFKFETWVGDDLRTCGVVLHRPNCRAADLDGLDLEGCARAAAGRDGASAKGKVVLVGCDGALVLQTKPHAFPETAACGNGIAAVARLPSLSHSRMKVFGPAGKAFEVALVTRGVLVAQTWTMASPTCSEDIWLGRHVLRLNVLNPYAILEGPLPAGVTPEQALHALVGENLTAKLAIVQSSPAGPFVSFYNATGAHGAAPMTGLVTLAIAARLSPWAAELFVNDKISYRTKAGLVTESLLAVSDETNAGIRVAMPTVVVRTSSMGSGSWS